MLGTSAATFLAVGLRFDSWSGKEWCKLDCNFNGPDVIVGSMDLRNGAYLWTEEDNEINFLVRGVLLLWNTERIRMWQNRTDFEEGISYRRKGVAKFNGFSRSGLKYRIAFLLAFKLQSRIPPQNHWDITLATKLFDRLESLQTVPVYTSSDPVQPPSFSFP